MRIEAFGSSDVGLRRQRNEDRLLIDHSLGLYLVCDGMGGHAAGDVAAETAVAAVHDYLCQHRSLSEPLGDDEQGLSLAKQLVSGAIQEAQRRVRREADRYAERRGMGTTLTMLLVAGRRAVVGHVGDSRLYRVRRGVAQLLTEDHTLIAQLAPEDIQAAEGLLDRYRHSLLRWIGSREELRPDIQVIDLRDGDCLLLCTDGLSNYPAAGEGLSEVLCGQSPERAAQTLIARARTCGGSDNITAVILQVHAEPKPGETASTVTDQPLSSSSTPYCFNLR